MNAPLLPGFADPIFGAQACFRAVLNAMSRPGTVHSLVAPPPATAPLQPATAAVLLTLADAETTLASDAGPAADAWIRFHCGASFVTADQAQFIVACGAMPRLSTLPAGTEEDPEESSTLILQVVEIGGAAGMELCLRGPGIEHEARLRVAGLPDDFAQQWAANHAGFPRGVDVILCAGPRLAALPRSIRVEV